MSLESKVVVWLQQEAALLYWPMRVLSELGPSTSFAIILTVLYWCWDARVMSRVWLVNILSGWMTSCLKLSFHSPRPYWIVPEITGFTKAGGFGMPSGHALVSSSVWTYLGRHWRTIWLRGFCLFAVLGVAVSRVFLGVHSVAQVLVGMALGMTFAWVFPWCERWVGGRFESNSLAQQLGFLFGASIAMALPPLLLRFGLRDWELPEEWIGMALEKRPADGAINPLSLHSAMLSAGSLFGFFGGYLKLQALGGLLPVVDWRGRVKRVLVGGLLLVGFMYLTGRVLHGEMTADLPFWGALTLDYLYGAWIGMLIALGIPLVFRRFRF